MIRKSLQVQINRIVFLYSFRAFICFDTGKVCVQLQFVSAAMDTVTEARASISMAREGGMGFIHRNLSIESQALEVDRVKKSESGMIVDPVTIHPEKKVKAVLEDVERRRGG